LRASQSQRLLKTPQNAYPSRFAPRSSPCLECVYVFFTLQVATPLACIPIGNTSGLIICLAGISLFAYFFLGRHGQNLSYVDLSHTHPLICRDEILFITHVLPRKRTGLLASIWHICRVTCSRSKCSTWSSKVLDFKN
jgi:hypothetical protein